MMAAMRTHLVLVLMLAALAACDLPPPPGSEGSGSSTTAAPASTSDATSSSTGTPVPPCEPVTYHQFACLGWEAGLYRNGGVGPYQFMNLPGAYNAFACSPQTVELDSPYLPQADVLAACRSTCEASRHGGWPETVGTWQLGAEVCVYASNGNNGSVPASYGFGTPGNVPRTTATNGCPGVWSVGGGFLEIPQVAYLGPVERCE